MAQGWDSYFHNLQPPSSDSRALRVASNSGGDFSQQIENLTEHHDFSNMVATQETPSTNVNVNTNFYTNSSTSRSDCVYQRHYGDMPWQAGGQQTGIDRPSSWRGSNLPDLARDGLSTSGHFPSSLAVDLYGLEQDCGMLNSSFVEGYSDVSSCPEADINAVRPSCKLMNRNSDEMTTCPNIHVTEKHGTLQWPFTSMGNISSPTRSHCSGSMLETPLVAQSPSFSESETQENVVECAEERMETVQNYATSCTQNDQFSGTSESVTTSESETEEDMNEHDNSQVQQQEKQGVGGKEKQLDASLGDPGNLTEDEQEENLNGKEKEQTYLEENLHKETTVVAPNSTSTFDSDGKDDLDGKEQENNQVEVFDTHEDPYPSLISTDSQDKESTMKKVGQDEEFQSSTSEPSDSQGNKESQVHQQERQGVEEKREAPIQEKQRDTSLGGHGNLTEDDKKENLNGEEEEQTYLKENLDPENTVVAPNSKSTFDSDGKDYLDGKVQENDQEEGFDTHGDPYPSFISTDCQDKELTMKKVGKEEELQSSTSEPSDSQGNKESQVQQQERQGVEEKREAPIQEKQRNTSLGDHGNLTEDNKKENLNGEEEEQTYLKENLDPENTVVAPNSKSTFYSDGKDDLDGKVQENDQKEGFDTHGDPYPSFISTDCQDKKLTMKKVGQEEELQSSTSEPSDSQSNESDTQNATDKLRKCTRALDAASEDNNDRSESNNQDVGSCLQFPESFESRSQDTIRSRPFKDSESYSVSEGENNEQSSFDLSESCLGLKNLGTKLEKEWTSSVEKTNMSSFVNQEQSLRQLDMVSPGLNRDFLENARESSQEVNEAPEQEPMLFGEPLSREDSDFEADETSESNQIEGNSNARNDNETMKHLGVQAAQLKSSVQMMKRLQPIVILKTSEPTNDTNKAYHCAECQQTTQNVDHLIEHHHHSHSQHKFQFCQTCNIYLTSNQRAEKHLCGVTEEVPDLPVDNTLKKNKFTPHKCKYCSQTFSRFLHYVKHMRTHTGKTPFKCSKCGSYFAQGSSLRKHQRIPERCQGTKPTVSNRSSIPINKMKTVKRDLLLDGSYGNLHKCFVKLVDVCKTNAYHSFSKSFTEVEKLKRHKHDVHKKKSGTSAFTQSGEHLEDENVHKQTEATEKHKCPLCPRAFKYYHNMTRHLRECVRDLTYGHKGKVGKKYPCPLCHVAFTSPSNRRRHIKNLCLKKYIRQLKRTQTESKKNNEEMKRMPAAIKLKRNVLHYKCSLCPAVFMYPSGKSRHMKKHELFKITGKLFRYRNSSFGSISWQTKLNGKKTEECKDTLPSNAESSNSSFTCRFCGKDFSTSFSLKKHERNHKGERPYRCLECRKGFKKKDHLIAHRIIHQRRIQCTVCRKILPSIGELIQHRQSHIKKGMLQCPDCPMKFQYPVYLIRHLTSHKHDEKKAFEVQEKTQQKPQQSLKEQKGQKQFSCSICKEVFPDAHTLRNHRLNHISGPYIFICSYCPRVFSRLNRLKKHHNGHKSKLLLSCSKCGQFFGYTKLTSHKKNCNGTLEPDIDLSNHNGDDSKSYKQKASNTNETGAKMFQHNCPHCQQKFKFRSFLLRHLVSHTREQPYACMHCGQKYGSKSKYLQHEAFCDGVCRERQSKIKSEVATKLLFTSSLTEANQKPQAEDKGEYKCKFCTKTFTKSRNLRRHILTHTEVKPYRCKACDSCFSRYDHLKLHETRCKGRRQRVEVRIPKISLEYIGKGWKEKLDKLNTEKHHIFDCKLCSRSFSSQTNLARHSAMLHTTKKSYSCTRCGSSFTHEKSLTSHKKQNKCKKPSIKTNESLQLRSYPQRENMTTLPHGLANRILQRIQPYSKEKRQYPCEYCPRFFKGRDQLKVHTRLHTGEKPFQCDNCGERFIRKDYMLRHSNKCDLRGEHMESVLCDRCGGVFSKEKLKNHQQSCTVTPHSPSHSKQSTPQSPPKGFSCACCNSRFLLFSQLQQHFLCAHKQDTILKPPMSAPPLQQQLSSIMSIKEEPLDEGYDDRQLSGDGNLLFDQDSGPGNENDKPFACPHCNIRFVNKGGLSSHMRVHSIEFPFRCKKCKKGFWNKYQQRNHFRKCRFGVVAKKDSNLESMALITSEMDPALNDSVLVFNQSSKTTGTGVLQTNFSCKDDLKDMQPHNSTEKQEQSSSSREKKAVQYQCSECDKSFTDGLMLISHLEDHGRVEQEKKRNTCSKCGKICASPSYLEKHMKVHANHKTFPSPTELDVDTECHDPNKQLVCKVCKLRFGNSQALCNHYNEAHPTDTCHICNKSYSLKTSLARHCKMRHQNTQMDEYVHGPVQEKNNTDQEFSIQVNANGESDTDNEDENDGSEDTDSDSAPYFPCHVCGKTFPTSESLEDHQRCHLGEKPHECAECGKCFFQASQLQQHQRTHKSEFQCQTCGRGFVSFFALRKHKHTHGKSRPYRCSKCSLSFKGPSQLADHMATHRDDNFPCYICNRTFSCKSSRAEHRKSHSKSQSGTSLSTLIVPEEKKTSPATSPSESSSTVTKQQKYRCGVCNERFKDPEELSEHGCVAAKERPYSCSDCDKHFLHDSHLKRHRANHHVSQAYIYHCNLCKMSFAYRQHYIGHLKRHGDNDVVAEMKGCTSERDKQGPPNIYKCPFCPAIFAVAMKMINHLSEHSDNTYECKICKLTYSSKSNLEEHEHCHLTAATQYECTECGKSFLGSDAFRQHRCPRRPHGITESDRSHPSTRESPVTSKEASGEEEEVDVTGEDFYNCPICSKRFSSKRGLLEHQNRRHPIEQPFKCELCGKAFTLRKYLRKHVARHQNIDTDHKAQLIEKPFKCSRCPVTLDTTQELSLHMREHAEEEVGDHRCDMCYKSFSQWSLLKQHQESHVGQVVYECTECDKAFAFPHLLEEHQKTHSAPSL